MIQGEVRTLKTTIIQPTRSTKLPPLIDWIPRVSPGTESPHHLLPVAEAFERILRGERVQIALSVPPRHWKSTTVLHGVIWLMLQIPGFRVAFLTYNDKFAERKSRDAQRIAKRAGATLVRDTFSEWILENGSVFRAAGINAGVTGEGFDLVVTDDPYKNKMDANSVAVRSRVNESYGADVYTRQGNTPSSFFVVHTRWHINDLIGMVIKPGWKDGGQHEHMNLPAINAAGEALMPKYWTVERLRPFMSDPRDWASLYMGTPLPDGGLVFGDPTFCSLSDIPTVGIKAGIGIDLAYSPRSHSDWSVRCDMVTDQRFDYVNGLWRKQCKAPDWMPVLKDGVRRWPGAPMIFHASGTERGSADFFIREGIPIRVIPASVSKLQRAQNVAAAWNYNPQLNGDQGRVKRKILVPRDAPWANQFIDEVCSFSGKDDDHDDDVDAMASAHFGLEASRSKGVSRGGDRLSSGMYDAY